MSKRRGRPPKNDLKRQEFYGNIAEDADMHIIMQLRKAADSVSVPFKVKFKYDDEPKEVNYQTARLILLKYNSLKIADDKEKFQYDISLTYDMMIQKLE